MFVVMCCGYPHYLERRIRAGLALMELKAHHMNLSSLSQGRCKEMPLEVIESGSAHKAPWPPGATLAVGAHKV
jgi:hypothetical protein